MGQKHVDCYGALSDTSCVMSSESGNNYAVSLPPILLAEDGRILEKIRSRRRRHSDMTQTRLWLAPPYMLPSMQSLADSERSLLIGDSRSGQKPLLTRRQLLTIAMLSLANFCSTVAFSCIAPFYPAEALLKQLSHSQVGIIFGVFELVVFITAPIMGRYICLVGSKFMFCSGLFITGGTAVLFGTLNLLPSGQTFFWTSLAVRMVEAVGDAAFVTASFTITAHSFPGRVATIVGLLETASGLGFTAGPVLGGVMYQYGGYALPFVVLGICLLLAALLSAFLIEKHSVLPATNSSGILDLLKLPVLLLMVTAIIISSMTFSFIDPTLSSHLAEFELSPMLVGLMFLWCGGVYTLTAPFWGYLIDRLNCSKIVMIFGAFSAMIAMFFIGPSPILHMDKSLYSISASLIVLGLAIGALYVPSFQSCLDDVKENGFPDNFETYGCVAGLFQSVFSLGGFIGPTIGGIAVEKIGFEWTSTILCLMHLLMTIALAVYNIKVYVQRKDGSSVVGERKPFLSDEVYDSGIITD